MKKDWKAQKKEKREQLKALSNSLKPLIKEGEFETVNEAIINYYRQENPEITTFKTFREWKAQGATVKKGEKAFVVWAQPRAIKAIEEKEQSEEEKEETFFPICYLFANTQVITAEEREQHRQAVSAPESGHTHPVNQEEEEALPF